jgi:hypothetical protein
MYYQVPSLRRFLSPSVNRNRKMSDTQAKNQVPESTRTPNAGLMTPFTPAPKFVVTDRRSKPVDSARLQPSSSKPLHQFKRVESIQEPSSFEDSSQDHDDQPNQDTQNSDGDILKDQEPKLGLQEASSPVRKKLKLADDRDAQHNAYHANLEPDMWENKATPSAPRYLPPTAKHHEHNFAPSRPSFITPAPTVESVEAALPAVFSPHKKSQKFLPTGLASSMRGHIIEATSAHAQSSGKPFSDYRIKILNSQRLSYGSLVEAQCQTGSKSNFLLIGNAQTPLAGGILVLNGLNWNVMLDDCPWRVVLDWKVES